jgi:bifunctional UDP-N-acetylglucosamine pyrophosphorylase/glucosamine-1-phosphate N-acetyltransferase
MRSVQVVILAAGSGTRMKSSIPKVLHPICGRPMIAYALDIAAALGVKQPIVVAGETAEQVQPHVPKETRLVIQKHPLGTGDALLCAKKAIGGFAGDLIVLYADTPLLRRTTIQRLLEAHHRASATCTLLTAHLADPTGYGRIVREVGGEISGVMEEAEATQTQRAVREINVGPLIVKAPALFEALAQIGPSQSKKEWYLTHAVGVLAKQPGAKVQAVRVENANEALGINTRVELVRATGIIRQRIIDLHLNNGVTILDPHTTYIDQGVLIGQDTVIHPGTVIEFGVTIGRRCSVGPYARLRRGVTLEDEVRVGNFVELVRTKVGHRVRMSHVSYLGDATIEDDVNIGAGTITANYNGTEKLPTTIGKGAFIGCDTILVAPVNIGHNAVTGAGSVIPKGHDVPNRGVVVGVPARPLEKRAEETNGAAPKPSTNTRARKQPARKPVMKRAVKPSAKRPVKRAARPARAKSQSKRR